MMFMFINLEMIFKSQFLNMALDFVDYYVIYQFVSLKSILSARYFKTKAFIVFQKL